MNDTYLLTNRTAALFYTNHARMPIIDYHCHLSPKVIFEDRVFDNIGEIWLAGDHYKWRLMRSAGIDEKYITGDASWHDKFISYASALEFSAGNPLYGWSHMELSLYFGIDEFLTSSNAEAIWSRANEYIKENRLSPRKLISKSRVEVICTTDDVTDSLDFHEKLSGDNTFATRVLPSFRTDKLLLMRNTDYTLYLKKLSQSSDVAITDLTSFKTAIALRLVYFIQHGCRFSDVGIPFFPDHIDDDEQAEKTFRSVLNGNQITDEAYLGLLGNLYLFLGQLYKENNIVMQWHLTVFRNANSSLFKRLGADCGGDCVGEVVDGNALIAMLDRINESGGLPQTVIYSLNPSNAAQIASIAGSFRNVKCGAAWWFCDHKRGIEEQLNILAENSVLGTFLGMLTDSRSFLSYARHDYFRRILCSFVGTLVENGEYDEQSANMLIERICYCNIKELVTDETKT